LPTEEERRRKAMCGVGGGGTRECEPLPPSPPVLPRRSTDGHPSRWGGGYICHIILPSTPSVCLSSLLIQNLQPSGCLGLSQVSPALIHLMPGKQDSSRSSTVEGNVNVGGFSTLFWMDFHLVPRALHPVTRYNSSRTVMSLLWCFRWDVADFSWPVDLLSSYLFDRFYLTSYHLAYRIQLTSHLP
jgi:hypothetical protein